MHLLSDDYLVEAYVNAVRQDLDDQFILLLQDEIKSRGLAVSVNHKAS
ncbi:MAG TPA: sporulation histidine kinase inhibitor Sda [Bacilli bacterium]|nr:sporulation histidine kinase inhibitor Sda [Bacilli bacterium]